MLTGQRSLIVFFGVLVSLALALGGCPPSTVHETLTYTAGANGTISGTSPQTVDYGASGTAVTALADAGYQFMQWSDDSKQNPRTDTNVTANISVTADFAVENETVLTVNILGPGSVSRNPAGTQYLIGTAMTLQAVPNATAVFVEWSGDVTGTENPLQVIMDTNHTVNATFGYTLTYTAGADGTISGTSTQTVAYGSNGTSVTAVPNTGYSFVKWSDNSTQNPRTDSNVTSNVSVTASFAINTYTLTYNAGANGSISGVSPQTVNYGASGTAVTAVPSIGYNFVQWSDSSAQNPRMDKNVTGNVSVTASFAIITYTLTYSAGVGGTISGTSPQTVNYGASGTAITAVPNTGFYFLQWSDSSTQNPRSDSDVTANITVSGRFASNVPNVVGMTQAAAQTAITGAGLTVGTVTQAYNATVPSGQVISQTPPAGTSPVPGTAVNLTVSQGPQPVIVPNGVGLTQAAAQTWIKSAGLTVGTITQQYSTSIPSGSVISQNPTAGAKVLPGSAVNLMVSAGLPPNPTPINSINDLQQIGNNPAYSRSGNYVLTQDIDASATATWNSGAGFSPIGNNNSPFTGVFDGQGYAILGLTINSNAQYVGIFGYVGSGGQVKNVSLQRGVVSDSAPCESGAAVDVGGLVGFNGGTVMDCYATGAVSISGSLCFITVNLGDLVGVNSSGGTVTQCYATGAVTTTATSTGSNVGGLVGNNSGVVTDCYATGAVSGSLGVGGLVGNNSGAVTDCYATGTVTGQRAVGGLVGGNSGTVTSSYWDMVTSGQATSAGGTGETTAQMMAQATLVGWDFMEIWDITEGQTYPFLLHFTQYTLTYAAGANGSITGISPQTIDYDASGTAVTATPSAGYHFVQWSDGSTQNPRTDTKVTENISVTASFANTYTLSYTAGEGGTISGASAQTVNYSMSGAAVTAIPNTGYYFVQWSDNSTQNPRTDANVMANISVTATFAITTFTLTYMVGANGTISGAASQTVDYGSNGTAVMAVPNTGYHFVQWNDSVLTTTRTDTNVTANISVTASFAINTYTLTYTAGANGTIAGASSQTVNYGASGASVTAVPATGYHFVQWSDASTQSPRTDTNVTANITVTASFAINQYTLTYTAGVGGTISGPTPQTVNYGSNGVAVTAVPNVGYYFVSWSDGVLTATRTDSNVAGNTSVTASFAINTYTLTYTAGTNGTISGMSPQTVNYGASGAAVTAVPNTGYYFVQWSDGSTQNPRTDVNVTGNVIVTASFAVPFSGGSGTADSPYLVSTAQDLVVLSRNNAFWGQQFLMTNDIDMSAITDFTPIGDTAQFTGVFDGGSYAVHNLTINQPVQTFVGLFGLTGSSCQIKNLGMQVGTISENSSMFVGGLIGANNGTVTRCFSTGAMSGAVTGTNALYVGGLIGNNNGTVTQCYSMGTVTGSGLDLCVGGLVGSNSGTVTQCYATGTVSCATNTGQVGGLVGGNGVGATVTDCYATGGVSGGHYTGGLVGATWSGGTITQCYATGAVTGRDYIGGLVSFNYESTLTALFWDKETSGQTTSAGGTGETTAAMMEQATFAGWDFTNMWDITEGQTYPFLR